MSIMKKALVFVLLSLLVTSISFGQSISSRYFKQIGENTVNEILYKVKTGKGDANLADSLGGWVQAIEVDKDHRPLSLDTLDIWVQHNGEERGGMSSKAKKADLVFACYRESIVNSIIRKNHVFPDSKGLIWSYRMENRFVAMTNIYSEVLEFAMEDHVLKDNEYLRNNFFQELMRKVRDQRNDVD